MRGHRVACRGARFVLGAMLLAGTVAHAATPLGPALDISTGSAHSCVALQAGGAACWGGSSFSDMAWLGRSTGPFAAGPVESLPDALTAIAVGTEHTCAATVAGKVKCWGWNQYSQLGSATFGASSRIPVEIAGLPSGVAALTAGNTHNCVIDLVGTARCWGENSAGQLGSGAQGPPNSVPVVVSGIAAATRIDAGRAFTCAVASGAAYCWGINGNGQLGDASTQNRAQPVPVVSLTTGVTRISAGGSHACAVLSGAVRCWGINENGQLGDGTVAQRTSPVNVATLSGGIVAVSAGERHSCALRQDGVVLCWGDNDNGQLGDGTFVDRLVPAPILDVGGPVVEVEAGTDVTCVRRADGRVKCFGNNSENRLGIASQQGRLWPIAVANGPWSSIDAGSQHTCAVTPSGAAYCMGANHHLQLGDGGISFRQSLPTPVVSLGSGVARIRGGSQHSCAVTMAGALYCWGDNSNSQLGDNLGDRAVPVVVPGLGSGVADVDAGGTHTCAVTTSGAAYCFGANESGQLGTGTANAAPAQVVGLDATAVSITTGGAHSCVLRTDGGVKCWGSNWWGQLGDGSRHSRDTPVDVVGLTNGVTAISAGRYQTCAIKAGQVLCWGAPFQSFPEIGNVVPVVVNGIVAATAISTGAEHACAVTSNGLVYCWGTNDARQLGPNASFSAVTPAVVPLPAFATAVTVGDDHSCARLANGTAMCWGSAVEGALGSGDTTASAVPRDVLHGTFTTTVVASGTPNPSKAGDLVTLSAHVLNPDIDPQGMVTFRDGSVTLCGIGVGPVHGLAQCRVYLTEGVHQLSAEFVPDRDLLRSQASFEHVVLPVAGEHCSGFDDVDSGHALCRNIDWVRNRNITLGCTPFAYCPAAGVNRLAMAAFMNRLGRVMSPQVFSSARIGTLAIVDGFAQCMTDPLPAADHPRRVYVDAMATGRLFASLFAERQIDTRVTASQGFGDFAEGPSTFVTLLPGQQTTIRASGTFDIPADFTVNAFAVKFRSTPADFGLSLEDGGCAVRVMIFNRDDTHAPFDTQP